VAWQFLGFVAIIWMSLAAVRETALRTDILVSSKPQPTERLALVKFLGAFLQILVVLLALFAGAVLGRLLAGGGLAGADAYVAQYLRAAGVLFFAASASYTLALLTDSAIAGALIALYWILTLSGKAFLGKFYFPAYTQNLGAYVALGLALLCLTLWLYRRSRRGAVPAAVWVRVGALAGLLLTGWLFWRVIRDGHDPQARLNPTLERMAEQDTSVGQKAPGFLLPDQNGRIVGLSDYTGKILVIGVWSPREPDAVLMLDRLEDLRKRFAAQGVQPIALCLSEDTGAAATFARGERLGYPVVSDWGTYNAPLNSDISPLGSAYRVDLLPKVVVTDRRRRVRAMVVGTQTYDGDDLEQLVRQRLAEEPQ
jgi:peroxiredoxin